MSGLRLVFFLTVILTLLTHVTSHAACEKYLTPSTSPNPESEIIQARIEKLNGRLGQLKAEEAKWAKPLLDALITDGSPVDLDIFEAFLSLNKRDTFVPFQATGTENPRSPYLLSNESWATLADYFFNSPAALTVTRIEDLNYLRHLLEAGPDSRERAERQWHISRLSRFQSVRQAFESWEDKRSLTDIKRHLERKMHSLVDSQTLDLLRQSLSSFDLFLIEKYLDQTLLRRVSQATANLKVKNHRPLTDWQSFSTHFSTGSLKQVVAFAEASSHDTELKAYLASIILKMQNLGPNTYRMGFQEVFELARWHVDGEIEDLPAPEQYQSNLSIFTLVGKRDPLKPGNPYVAPQAAEIHVRWNAKLGRLESSLAGLSSLKANLRIKDRAKLVRHLNRYFDHFRQDSDYSDDEIQKHLEYELGSSLVRNTYVVFTRPEFPDDAVAMVRIFNGSAIPFSDHQLDHAVNSPEAKQTSIEYLFPNLFFPERKDGSSVREIGRMLAVVQEINPPSFSILMARVADLLYSTGARGSAYFCCSKAVREHHARYGAEVIFTPDELNLPAGTDPKWIMRIPVRRLTNRFFKRFFETVRLKRPPSQFLVDGPTPDMIYSHASFQGPPGYEAEAALLRQDEGDMSLFITHRKTDDVRLETIIDNAHLNLHTGVFFGLEPNFEVVNGRLVLMQQHQAIGRTRWQRRLTIAWLDGEYMVTNFAYSRRDTLMPGTEEDCEYDLINGVGVYRGQQVQVARTRLRLNSLRDHEALHTCLGW